MFQYPNLFLHILQVVNGGPLPPFELPQPTHSFDSQGNFNPGQEVAALAKSEEVVPAPEEPRTVAQSEQDQESAARALMQLEVLGVDINGSFFRIGSHFVMWDGNYGNSSVCFSICHTRFPNYIFANMGAKIVKFGVQPHCHKS